MVEITREEIAELKRLRGQISNPHDEEKEIRLICNTGIINDKSFNQFKLNIPKPFADIIGLNVDDFEAKAILKKQDKKIIIEIEKK